MDVECACWLLVVYVPSPLSIFSKKSHATTGRNSTFDSRAQKKVSRNHTRMEDTVLTPHSTICRRMLESPCRAPRSIPIQVSQHWLRQPDLSPKYWRVVCLFHWVKGAYWWGLDPDRSASMSLTKPGRLCSTWSTYSKSSYHNFSDTQILPTHWMEKPQLCWCENQRATMPKSKVRYVLHKARNFADYSQNMFPSTPAKRQQTKPAPRTTIQTLCLRSAVSGTKKTRSLQDKWRRFEHFRCQALIRILHHGYWRSNFFKHSV